MASQKIKASVEQVTHLESRDVFSAFHHKLIVSFRKKAECLDFTFPQIETLRFIVENKNPTMKDIAEYLRVSAPSATSAIEHLSHKKLVKRLVDKKDRRTVRITLTPKALKLFSVLKEVKNQVFSDMLKNLTHEEKEQLVHLIKKLI
jgi:DNA-binding MarR family transcriptional regulator